MYADSGGGQEYCKGHANKEELLAQSVNCHVARSWAYRSTELGPQVIMRSVQGCCFHQPRAYLSMPTKGCNVEAILPACRDPPHARIRLQEHHRHGCVPSFTCKEDWRSP
jgi:hypothetical protein